MAKRKNRSTRTRKPSKRARNEPKHLVQRDGSFCGILSRDSNYRENARDWMKETGYFDDEGQIQIGVKRQKSVIDAKGNLKQKLINEKIPKYKFDYINTDKGWEGVVNFTTGGRPYGWQAHHILVCEAFYDDDLWDFDHLRVVKECDYDINNEENIIYLPNDYSRSTPDSCYYHDLPNHGWKPGHPRYSEKVLDYELAIWEKADEALDEENCNEEKKEKLLDELYEMLINIEDEFFEYIVNKGPGPLD